MNVFDIIGPVMVGPSSSHTAGAVKIGRIARKLLGEEPRVIDVKFHGSFARTYRGHGTDRAVIGGLLGMRPDDLRIRDSLELAGEAGISFAFSTVELKDAHPNTVLLAVQGRSGREVRVTGVSVGGGNILIRRINGLEVEFSGQYDTMIVPHRDVPGVIAAVTNLLSDHGINIAQMKVFRSCRGGEAVMVIETDQQPDAEVKERAEQMENVYNVTIINPV